jgi:hypothetical protein
MGDGLALPLICSITKLTQPTLLQPLQQQIEWTYLPQTTPATGWLNLPSPTTPATDWLNLPSSNYSSNRLTEPTLLQPLQQQIDWTSSAARRLFFFFWAGTFCNCIGILTKIFKINMTNKTDSLSKCYHFSVDLSCPDFLLLKWPNFCIGTWQVCGEPRLSLSHEHKQKGLRSAVAIPSLSFFILCIVSLLFYSESVSFSNELKKPSHLGS